MEIYFVVATSLSFLTHNELCNFISLMNHTFAMECHARNMPQLAMLLDSATKTAEAIKENPPDNWNILKSSRP